jgi:glycosyltransferase involved in cell wall biosynthesis
MVIWYLNHYAAPSDSGIARRPHDLARFFQRRGHTFIIFCASFHHLRKAPADPESIGRIRLIDKIAYYHVKTCDYKKNDLFRIANMLGYTARISRLDRQIRNENLPRPDIIIPSCAHIFSYLAAAQLKKKLRVKLVYEVRDIWPLSLIHLAGASPRNPLIIWMKHIEQRAYREADAVVSLLPNALEHMRPMGLDDARYHYIPNGVWADEWGKKPVKVPSAHQQIFDWCTQHKKLKIVYTGSHGPPNALDQIFALKKTVDKRDVPYHFVLIGDGIQKSELMVQVKRQRISFIDILPRVNQDEVPAILNQADVCFLGWQKKPIYDLGISPNKLCDYFLAAKPVLHAYQGSHDPVAAAGAGITVEPFNPRQLDDALRKFCEMTDAQRQFMGSNGKQYALAHLEWSVIGEDYYRMCRHLVSE